ncbi:Gp15 family bacteriophage protein [Ruminococcus flavefaciens]|uniref:Gp15 family bacteriophage protein n=1 Tax=Ruminococcus flavefaciens TaxID=1265 RepID=UPI003F077069
MIGELPKALDVNGKTYAINSDFRNILTIFEAFNDSDLTNEEKAFVCIMRLYRTEIPSADIEEAIRKAYWFCDGGDMPKTKPEKVKTLDWKHDEQIIFPAISKTAGVVDIRELPYMHWWTFLGCFGEIGEGLFSTVMHIRQKKAQGKSLDKWEKEFYNKNKELVKLITPEEQAEIDETEAVLKELI